MRSGGAARERLPGRWSSQHFDPPMLIVVVRAHSIECCRAGPNNFYKDCSSSATRRDMVGGPDSTAAQSPVSRYVTVLLRLEQV